MKTNNLKEAHSQFGIAAQKDSSKFSKPVFFCLHKYLSIHVKTVTKSLGTLQYVTL